MLAYIAWHRPAPDVDPAAYEHAIERFHSSLAHRPPSGFDGSVAFRAAELPWLRPTAGASFSWRRREAVKLLLDENPCLPEPRSTV